MGKLGFFGKHTEASKQKMRDAKLGKALSPEHRSNISLAHKISGLRPPNPKGTKWTLEQRKRASEYWKAHPIGGGIRKPLSPESIEKIRKSNTGQKRSLETRAKMRAAALLFGRKPPSRKGTKESFAVRLRKSIASRGAKSRFWKGGLTKANQLIRRSLEYKIWREAVFKRDNFTCIWCKERGGNLNADHIKPFSLFPELRFAIDNGRTLCHDCHKTTDTYGNRSRKFITN